MSEQVGAIIEAGLDDWQIVQQDEQGVGTVDLKGRWVGAPDCEVEIRVAAADTGVSVVDWRAADVHKNGTWTAALSVPAGGLYRLETRLRAPANAAGEWSPRGDMRHFWGVGDLWVIAGQSNSAGYGRGPYEDPPEIGVHLFRNSETWALASHPMNESTQTQHPVNREGGNPGHSPYLQFGRLLQRALHYPIGLVQTSLGGSPLARWNPREEGPADLFDNMVQCVQKVGGARGVLWYQGETDAGNQADADTYAERFGDAVAAWREALSDAHLPVLTVQLNRVYGRDETSPNAWWTQVRQAQRRVAQTTDNVAVVPTLDLPLSDGIHTSPAGNMLLGERLARAALDAVYSCGPDHRAPDIERAERTTDGRIVLHFANVQSRMDSIDENANCFRVEDDEGEVGVKAVHRPMDATLALVLSRPLVGGARVHGAWGTNPETAPMDMERFIPMLGFYGVEVQ
jgi:sialate O-acetylesterase